MNIYNMYVCVCVCIYRYLYRRVIDKGTQIPNAKTPERLNIVWWPLTFVGFRYGTCFMLPFFALRFLRWVLNFWKICEPLCIYSRTLLHHKLIFCVVINKCSYNGGLNVVVSSDEFGVTAEYLTL
jgi:hypothetical protein